MKLSRLRLCVSIPAFTVLIPPIMWATVVLVAPTDWAKRHVVACMEARTHRSVRLEGLSVRWLGGIRLTNLEIGSPQGGSDPWLKTREARLDVSLSQLLGGKLEPSVLDVDGLALRVLRRRDGTFELADLIRGDRPSSQSGRTNRDTDHLTVQVRNATIDLVDESTRTKLVLRNVEGEGALEGRRSLIHYLRGVVNGGPFRFAGQLDRSLHEPRVDGHFLADDVNLDDGMTELLRYVVPILAGSELNLKGRLHSDCHLRAQGLTWAALSQSMVGEGSVYINPIELDGAPVVDELRKIAEFSGRGRVASVHSDFLVKDRRITTDHFTLTIGRVPITMSGWTDFDGSVDYRIKLETLTQRIPDRARRILGELKLDVESSTMLTLVGSVDRIVVKLNGTPLDRNILRDTGLRREDREKLRVLGRQFLDKIAR